MILKTKKYNKLINIDEKVRFEKMYRNDHKYDMVIPIKYNFTKPKSEKEVLYFTFN